MSDWEEEMYDESEEELSFDDDDAEMEDNESATSDGSPQLESWYFQAKNLKEENALQEALQLFGKVIQYMENKMYNSDEYIFKSIKQSLKIHEKLHNYDNLLELLDTLFLQLQYVDHNYGNSSIYKILLKFDNRVYPFNFQKQIYEKYTHYLNELAPSQEGIDVKRIRMKVELLHVDVLIAENKLDEAIGLLQNLETEVGKLTGSIKSTYMLDIIVSELTILMTNDLELEKIRRLVALARENMTGIPHAKVIGVINEAIGLVEMYDRRYSVANDHFRISFKGFNDAGDDRRILLSTKYIISSLLSRSQVNPFDSNDFHGLMKSDLLNQLMELYECVEGNDINAVNSIMKRELFLQSIERDSFMKDFIPSILELVRTNYLLLIIPMMKRVSFQYLSNKLEVNERELQKLVFKLYNRGDLTDFKIDFIEAYIETINDEPIICKIDTLEFVDRALLLRREKYNFAELEGLVIKYENAKENGYQPDATPISQIDGVKMTRNLAVGDVSLSQQFNSLYIPSHVKFKLLRDLYPTIRTVKSTSWNNQSNPLKIVDFFIKTLTSGIPMRRNIEMSRIQSAKVSAINNESKKIYNGNDYIDFNENRINRIFKNNDFIPDVVQYSEMGAIEPPINPNSNPDDLLSPIQKLETEFSIIYEIINELNDYQITNRISSSKLKLNNYNMRRSQKRPKGDQHLGLFNINNERLETICTDDEIEDSITEASEVEDRDFVARPMLFPQRPTLNSPSLKKIKSLHLSEVSSVTSDSNDEMGS